MKEKQQILPTLLLFCVLALAGCAFSKDTSPPVIQSMTPSAGASGVPVDQTLTFNFSEDIATESFRAHLWKNATEIQLGAASGTRSVLVKPLRPLDYGTSYRLVVDGGYRDLSDNTSAAGYELNFTTAAKNTNFLKGSVIVDSFIKRIWDNVMFSPQKTLRDNGMTLARVGVTTVSEPTLSGITPDNWSKTNTPWRNSYWSCREMAGQILTEAKNAGCTTLDAFPVPERQSRVCRTTSSSRGLERKNAAGA